uniref:Chromosome 7 open reading frame 33 n=1 Tax=Callithrix jacchus TaxID=9483 RepID=F6V782_CALJA
TQVGVQSPSLEECPWGLPGPECECKAPLPSGVRHPSDVRLGGRADAVWVHFRGGRGQFNLSLATGRHKKPNPHQNMKRGMEFIAPLSAPTKSIPRHFLSQGPTAQRTVRIRPGTRMGLSSDPVSTLSSKYLALLTLSYKPGRRVTSSHLNVCGQEVRKLQNSVKATRISRTGSS